MKKLTESELQKLREIEIENAWVDALIDDTLIDALFLENPYDQPDEAESD